MQWRAILTYLSARLSENGTRIAIALLLSHAGSKYAPDDIATMLELLGYVCTILIMAVPEKGNSA